MVVLWRCIVLCRMLVASGRYFELRPLPFFGGADEVIFEVDMSSPIYLDDISRIRAV